MSCGRLALDRLGIEVDKYYASEIDKYAIQVAQANYPDTIHIGDVCDIKPEDYQDIDLILAGSPCQGFSFAGKQLAFDDPRSALFFEFVRLLKEIKPKYFLLENVKMKKEFLDVISEQVSACYPDFEGGDMFGGKIEPILINSALVSAQNRQRYYWTNILGVEQPEQRGIVLRDILENGFDSERDKSYCLDANYYKGSSVENYFKKSRRQMVYQDETHDTPKVVGGAWRGRSLDKDGKNVDWKSTTPKQMLELRKDEKSNALSQVTKDNVIVQSYREVRTEEAKRLRRESKQKTGKDHTPFRAKELVPREDGKVGPVTPGLNNDHLISLQKLPLPEEDVGERIVVDEEKKQLIIKEATNKGFTVIEDGDCFDISYPKSKTRRGRNMKYKCNALTATNYNYMRYEHPKDKNSDVYWRKLTCVECERLQTVPDNYTNHVSNTQRYKMLGNGWTIEVIAHILKNIK